MPYLTTTGGLNFQYPTDGTQNWGSTLKTSFNTISAHNHTGAPNGTQLGTNSLQANAVTEPKIRLTNNAYLRGRNAADSADVNILKVNSSDVIQIGNSTSNILIDGANINLTGTLTFGSGMPSITFPTASAATPGIAFTGDPDSGFFSSAANTVNLSTGGTERWKVDISAVTSTLPRVAPLGAVGTPSYTFTGDLNTGIYSSGADTVDIATNGVQRVSVSTSATTSTLPLVAPLGAVGTPSYTFTGDLNTGIYSSGADALGLVTGGTERIRIDSSGNIGAGTTSPKDRIQVGTITAISPTNSAGANGSIFGFNHYYSSGSKAIVTGNRTVTVELSNDGGFLKSTTGTQTADSALTGMNDYVRWGGSNDNIVFYTGNTQRAVIDSSGRLGIGTAASYQLHLSTDSAAKPTTNTWTIVSDERVKTNIQNYTKGLSELLQVRPITYDYNGLGGLPEGPGGISIVAQELRPILPECVGAYQGYLNPTDEEPTEILNYNGHAMTFVLINAIKELHTRIAALEAQP
jgi:hypothetical protein